MYYNEELGREQSAAEVLGGIVLLVAVVGTVWAFLEWSVE